MAEGAPLLREYVPKAHRGFESLRLRQRSVPRPPTEDQADHVKPRQTGLFRFLTSRQVSVFSNPGMSLERHEIDDAKRVDPL